MEEIFKVTFTEQGYSSKPVGYEYGKMEFCEKEYTLDEVINQIREGHTYSANLKRRDNKPFKMNGGKEFASTHLIHFDFDDSTYSPQEVYDKLEKKPTFVYTSFSHKLNDCPNNNRFHLVYVFQNIISSEEEYKRIWNGILKEIENSFPLYTVDKCSASPKQIINGSNSSTENYEEYVSNYVYDISDFKDYTIQNNMFNSSNVELSSINEYTYSNSSEYDSNVKTQDSTLNYELLNLNQEESEEKSIFINNITHTPSTPNITFDMNILFDGQWIQSIKEMDIKSFIDKYHNMFVHKEHSDIDYNERGYAVIEGKDYYEHYRGWEYRMVHGEWKRKPKKVSIGKRHRLLPKLAMLIRHIWNDAIKLEELVYELAYEVYFFFDNRDNEITMKTITQLALSSLQIPLLEMKPSVRHKFKVYKQFCQEHGMSVRQYVPKVTADIRAKKVFSLYDINLHIKDNKELLNLKGFKCSLIYLKQWKLKYFGKGKITPEAFQQAYDEIMKC